MTPRELVQLLRARDRHREDERVCKKPQKKTEIKSA